MKFSGFGSQNRRKKIQVNRKPQSSKTHYTIKLPKIRLPKLPKLPKFPKAPKFLKSPKLSKLPGLSHIANFRKMYKSNRPFTLAILLFALILIISGAAWGTSQSDFCASCHEIQPDHATWTASTHSKVACVDCHEAPGIFGRMASKALAIQNVSSHISSVFNYPVNKDSELSKTIPSEQCTSCHNAPKAQEFGLLAFDHAKHTKTNCSYCHNRIAHEGYTTYTDRTEMESCLKCHETKKASVACITCHPNGVAAKPSTHLTGDWITTHKPMASAKCYTGCHSQSFCNNCHKGAKTLPASHKAANWSKTHKSSVNASCSASCHAQSFCNKCHKNSSVRPASHKTGNWVGSHRNSANTSCTASCHAQTYCANCHKGSAALPASHKASNWSSSHKRLITNTCTRSCHSQSFCDNCHRSSNARPASHNIVNWSIMHKQSVNSGCAASCHNQTYCNNCHHSSRATPASHKTGDWIATHRSAVNNGCTGTCHDPAYCTQCHGTRAKPASHGPGFARNHEHYVDGSCLNRCHTQTFCQRCHGGGRGGGHGEGFGGDDD